MSPVRTPFSPGNFAGNFAVNFDDKPPTPGCGGWNPSIKKD